MCSNVLTPDLQLREYKHLVPTTVTRLVDFSPQKLPCTKHMVVVEPIYLLTSFDEVGVISRYQVESICNSLVRSLPESYKHHMGLQLGFMSDHRSHSYAVFITPRIRVVTRASYISSSLGMSADNT
jgi:hypothetical protein